MEPLLQMIRKRFSNLHYGYFNPPKERFQANLDAMQKKAAP
jgi:hypothetical protein